MSTANDNAAQIEETVTETVVGGTTKANVGTINGGQTAVTQERTMRQQRIHNQNRKPTATTLVFKGETSKMNGHVFQIHYERNNKSQSMETVEALRVFDFSTYKSEFESLTALFTKLEQLEVKEPDEPTKVIKIVKRVEVETLLKFEGMKLTDNVKQ